MNYYMLIILMKEEQINYAITSLATCNNASCVSNIVEICISSLLILWLIYQFIMQIKVHMRLHFSWQEVMLVQIFLSLSFNICFSLWSTVIIWYLLQAVIFQLYFTTLVYYFAIKYLQKRIKFEQRKPYIISLIIIYALFCLAQLGLFVALVNQGAHRCKQIGQIIINAIMITIGLLFFYLAYRNETQELKKFEQYKVNQNTKNPLINVWIWVCLNLIGQIISEIQNILIYNYYGSNQCTPIQSNLETDILAPIFMFFSLHISFGSTLWFYNRKRKLQEQSQHLSYSTLELASAQIDIDNRIQIHKSSAVSEARSKDSLLDKLL